MLHLHGNALAAVRHRAVHLRERGARKGLAVKAREERVGVATEVPSQHVRHRRVRRRGARAQRVLLHDVHVRRGQYVVLRKQLSVNGVAETGTNWHELARAHENKTKNAQKTKGAPAGRCAGQA